MQALFTLDGEDYRRQVPGGHFSDLPRVLFNSFAAKVYGFRQALPVGVDLNAVVDLLIKFVRGVLRSPLWWRLRVRVWHKRVRKACAFLLQCRQKRLQTYEDLMV